MHAHVPLGATSVSPSRDLSSTARSYAENLGGQLTKGTFRANAEHRDNEGNLPLDRIQALTFQNFTTWGEHVVFTSVRNVSFIMNTLMRSPGRWCLGAPRKRGHLTAHALRHDALYAKRVRQGGDGVRRV